MSDSNSNMRSQTDFYSGFTQGLGILHFGQMTKSEAQTVLNWAKPCVSSDAYVKAATFIGD